MLQNIGIPGLILILVIALIIFGPSKLPQIGRAFGNTLKEFKSATKGLVNDEKEDQENVQKAITVEKHTNTEKDQKVIEFEKTSK